MAGVDGTPQPPLRGRRKSHCHSLNSQIASPKSPSTPTVCCLTLVAIAVARACGARLQPCFAFHATRLRPASHLIRSCYQLRTLTPAATNTILCPSCEGRPHTSSAVLFL